MSADKKSADKKSADKKSADKTVANAAFRKLDGQEDPEANTKPPKDTYLKFDAGELLFKHGDTGGDLMFIKEGEVEVFRAQDGKEFHFCNMGVGEVLGVATMLDQGKRAASVRAITDVKVQVVRYANFKKMIESAPKWLSSLVKDLGFRLEGTNKSYIEKASRLAEIEGNRGSTLMVSAHMAKSLQIVAKLETTTIETRKVSPLEAVMKKVSYIGHYQLKILDAVVEIFKAAKVIECENANGIMFLTKNDTHALGFYEEAVKKIEDAKGSKKEYFSLRDLDLLRELAKLVIGPEAKLKKDMKLGLDELKRIPGNFGDELLDKCLGRNLFERQGDNLIIKVEEFVLNVNCLDAMLRIRKNLSDGLV